MLWLKCLFPAKRFSVCKIFNMWLDKNFATRRRRWLWTCSSRTFHVLAPPPPPPPHTHTHTHHHHHHTYTHIYTLVANVWLHGFIFRHNFEIVGDSSYKACSRWQQINAQMQIVSLNWWQYVGRVWSHANSTQPPNSHLAPKLKINMAHWNNSLHICGTWYFPSDPYTSGVCARL